MLLIRVHGRSWAFVAASLFSVLTGTMAAAQQAPAAGPAAPAAANPSDPPIPRYEVHRAPSSIVIDGKLDDRAWSVASPPATLQFLWDAQTGAKQMTYARILWDDQNLYIGYDVDDTDITALLVNRDDPTYRDDAVEIFINPRPTQLNFYFGLEMNARAVYYDYVMINSSPQFLLKRLNLDGVQVSTMLRGTLNARGDTDQGWSLEVAIPLTNFEEAAPRPVVGATWTANLNRWDGVAPDRRMSIWSNPLQATARPHFPARFGELHFVE